MPKYEFTGETKQVGTKDGEFTLHRIRAIRSFGKVNVGDLGGWIEKEENLSHQKNAWVMDEAEVMGKAKVRDNAVVRGSACVGGSAEISGNAEVCNNTEVWDNVKIKDYATLYQNTEIYGNAEIAGSAIIVGNVWINGDVRIGGHAEISGKTAIEGDVQISGDTIISSNVRIRDGARISSKNHILVIGPIGSRSDYTAFFRDKNGGITVTCGCFMGDIETFLNKVVETHGFSKHAQVYCWAAGLAMLQMEFVLQSTSKPEKEAEDAVTK